ncbi:hypothetical protein J6590_047148 [Homalodisca vitripennis]|nr:hypothetical protein J6590_047148 [Homalodisca vitripennis]
MAKRSKTSDFGFGLDSTGSDYVHDLDCRLMEINMTQTEIVSGATKYESIKHKYAVCETWTVTKWKLICHRLRPDLEQEYMKVSNISTWYARRPGLSPNGNQYDTDRAGPGTTKSL